MEFRTLRADEIDVRIQSVKGNGIILLLYKDARVDTRILDETVGAMNWKKSYQTINGNLFCTVSIWDDDKQQWIDKADVGTPSFTEPVKGEASDAFKRGCFAWNLGTELYTAPFIWVPADKCNIKQNGQGKDVCNDRFHVQQIIYDDNKRIVALAIWNDTKKCRCFCQDYRKENKVA